MHRRFLAAAALWFTCLGPLHAGLSQEQASQVIQTFLENPTAPSAMDSARQILKYCEDTPDHEVTIDPKFLPWLKKTPTDESSLLLAAFMGGDLQEQIKKGTGKPESYAGVLATLAVYQKLKAQKLGFRMESLERFLDLEKQGKLKAYIEKKQA